MNDCCRGSLASVTMAEYPNVQFVVSDDAVGSGCVDFDNSPDDLTVLQSVTVMRNVHHDNVMFIYQLAGPDGTNCIVFVTCTLFITICKKGICSVVGGVHTSGIQYSHSCCDVNYDSLLKRCDVHCTWALTWM